VPLTFYGEFSGASSFPVVCRAITRWLVARGRAPAICDLQQQSCVRSSELEQELRGVPRVSDFDRAKILSNMRALQDGRTITRDDIATSGTGLLFAFPGWAWACPPHPTFIGYHVCDVDVTPTHWPAAMNEIDDAVLTPSKWCAQVFRNMGVTRPIRVVRHGVDPEVYKPAEQQRIPNGRAKVLRFFCSSETGGRKSLHETIAAWKIVQQRLPGKAQLVVRGSSPEIARACANVPELILERGSPMRPTAMAQLLRETDLLLVPSRAEGFGLQGIESLAVSTPIVVTDCTGMAEWVHTVPGGTAIVETGDLEACPPGYGKAPSIDVGHLADVVTNALRDLESLKAGAAKESPIVRRKWSWENVLSGSALDKLTEG
jgi:glycosyltransferase involved in cell wall biosynthesis